MLATNNEPNVAAVYIELLGQLPLQPLTRGEQLLDLPNGIFSQFRTPVALTSGSKGYVPDIVATSTAWCIMLWI